MADVSLACFNAGGQAGQLWLIYEALREQGSTVPEIDQKCFIAGTEASQLWYIYQAIKTLPSPPDPYVFGDDDLDYLPTSDPGGGHPWNNGGVLSVGPA